MLKSSMLLRVVILLLVFGSLVSVRVSVAQSIADPINAVIIDENDKGSKSGVTGVGFVPFESESTEPTSDSAQLITATSYVYSTLTGVALEDISTGSTLLVGGGADDTASAVTPIGFNFWYDGVAHNQFSVNVNGLARLGSTAIGTTFNNSTDGLGTVTNAPKIAPYFEDLCTGSTGGIRYKVVGTAPNRKLVVEWFGMEIPREGSCSVLPQTGVFQMWLFESEGSTTPGMIQFVYGGGVNPSVADLGASVGLQSGAATNFASVTLADDTVSYVTANNTNLGGIASGKSYLFTPANTPAAPTGLNFTVVGPVAQTLNWTDNATNELSYAVFRSTDGINYTLVGQTAADATSFTDTLLTPSTNYFYRVYAAAEGIASTALAGSNSTNAGGSISCAGAGGNWSDTAAWTGGVVPTATDNVTIGSGCSITIDTATAVALNVTIASGGTLQAPLTGTVTTNNLTVGGSVTNNGTLDLSTNADTSAAILTFGAGGFDTTLGGTGATTDVRSIVVAKGARSTTVELNPTNFTVLGVNTDSGGFLTLTSGTFKIGGTFTATNRVFTTAAYTIPALGGFWLNNPNFTVAGQNGSPTNSGLLRISNGVFNVGTASGNSMGGGVGGIFTIEGGTSNFAGRLQTTSAITYNQSGGDVNVCTVGNTATTACFGLTSTANTFNMSGGNITLVTPSGNATPLDYSVSTSATVVFVTNPVTTVLNVGTGATAQNFRVLGATPSLNIPANKTMNVGSGTAGGAIFHRGATVVNNGIIAVQGTGASSRFDFAAGGPMTYGGSGVFGTATVPFGGVGISANSSTASNTTINSPIFINRVNLFNGGFVGSGNITFGDGLASASVVQTGNSAAASNAGTFDVSPNYNIGSGGHILLYLRTTTLNRVTGFEIPPSRSVLNLTHDDNAVGGTLGLSGGNLTVTGAMTLTNGILLTGASKVIHNGVATRTTGFIDGNLERSFTAIGAYTYFVGQNAFSPVVANVTALGTNPSSLMARAVDVSMPGLETNKSLSRHWVLTETGDLTADVSFIYAADAADVNGIETDYRIYKNVGGVITNECSGAPCVNDALNTLGPLVGVTDFNAAWSGGENGIIDANAPNTTIDSQPNDPINSSAATFTFSGTDTLVGIAGFECRIDGGAFGTCTSPKTYTGLADGSHTFDVRAVDTAGNPDPTPASYTWVIDTVVPDTTILTSPTNPTTDTNATFTFNASGLGMGPTYTFECKLDTGMFAACSSPQSYMGLAVGPHTFEVRATDPAGNVDPTPASYAWTINAAATNVTVTASAGTPSANYATLKDAIDAINGGTHQGVIAVAINTNTTETAPSVLNSSGAGSASYTSISIRPSADGVTVAGPTATGRGLIELNGADNVTIDGDNSNSMGTNRNLTIQNTAANTVTFTSVIRVALNTTTVNSADGNIFRNLNIVGSATGRNIIAQNSTSSVANTSYGIVATGSASGATTAPTALSSVTTTIGTGATASNLTVSNNSVTTAGRAISVHGSATTVFPGLSIQNNSIGNPTAADLDQVYVRGISAQGSANGVISGNTVYVEGFVGSSGTSATVGIDVGGISANGTFTIEKNKVNRVRNNEPQTWATYGINTNAGNAQVIRNNFVSDVLNNQVAGTGAFSTSFGAFGIRIGSGLNHQVYHNSVNMFGALPGTISTDLVAAFGIVATGQTGVDARNNIFVNTVTGGNPAGTRNVAVFLPSGATSAMNLTLNNNGYFVGADAQNRLAQVGTTFGTGEFTLANFDPTMTTPATNFRSYTSALSVAGTNDNASLKVDPLFVSNTDLHLQAASPMLELGANAGVTDDIDGDARDSVPDIGADELAAAASADLSITKTDGVTTAIPGGSVTYTITASNAGPDPITGGTVADTFPAALTATWTCVGAGGGTCTAAGSGNINDTVNLPVGGSVTYTASATISPAATGTLSNTATVSSSTADPNSGNNSATDTDTLTPTADLSITKTDGVATVTAGGTTTYTIVASNAGPSNTTGTVADTFPAAITAVNWTCVGAGGGTCTAAGSGNINDAVNLPAGGSVTYTAVSTISGSATGTLSNTATVSGIATDPNPGSNSATDVDTVTPAGLGGTIPVGTGETYTSLTNTGGLFEAMNTLGVTSNVTINITSDLSGETGTVALNENAGGFTVLIKPTGAARTITGSSTVGIIRINSADGVTIDGSLSGGTATGVGGDPMLRNLTIRNTSTTATAGGVVIVMTGANGANNFTIKNVNVSGQDPTQTLLGIHIGGATPGASPTTAPNLNSRVENCSVQRAILGIFNNGLTATPATGTVITRNDLSATGANRLRRGGIFFFNQNGIQVTENSIGGLDSNESADSIGIIAGVQNVNASATATGGITNALIAGNKINGITASSTVGFSAVGIAISGGTTGANTIQNNMISGVVGPSTSPDFVAGIFVAGAASSNTKLYYNSVSVTGDRGTVASQIGSYGIAISGTNPVVELKNNIFFNTQTSGGGANAKSYAIGMTSTTFTNLASNYNDFFVSGANAGFFRTGSLDTTGTDLATLAAWQTATAGDANSLFADPLYVSTSDLHVGSSSPVSNVGTPIAGVTTDFDGQTRSVTTPDIGADEFTAVVPGTLQFGSATYNVSEGGGTVTVTVTRTGGSDGAVSATYSTGGGTASGGVNCLSPGADYAGVTDSIFFANGQTSATFSISICEDTLFEGNETFGITLSAPTGGATIGSPSATTVTIADNEAAPTFQFSSATYGVTETLIDPNIGGPGILITINRTGTPQGNQTIDYATVAGGTATVGANCTAGVDYRPASGTITFLPNETSRTFFVEVCGDTVVEPAETVNLAITNPTGGAVLGTPNTAVLTITDNDVTPGGNFSINDVRVTEGNSGTVNAQFTVTYTAGGAANVTYATGFVTATALDFVSTTATLSFPASASTQTQTFNVTVNGDTNKEPNEVFIVLLTGPTGGATITDNTGYGVIRDEDRSYFADFDDDLKADYSVHRQSEQRHYVLRSSDGGNIVMNFGLATDVAVPGDYDGDGKTDIGLYRPSTSTYYVINSSTNTVKGLSVGAAGDKPVQGDYNGDGRTDLATFSSSGLWSILFINDGTSTAVNFGLAGDRPVQADYDGDAKTDIAVYRDGTWYILRSSDSSVSVSNWGLATDKPVSGDFDGDGRFDLAVYRGAGQWWIQYSLNGNTGVIAWGLATDVTAPADYDGDGTTDVAIFRPSDGDWYVLQSSTMTITGVHWGLAGDAPIPNKYLPQ